MPPGGGLPRTEPQTPRKRSAARRRLRLHYFEVLTVDTAWLSWLEPTLEIRAVEFAASLQQTALMMVEWQMCPTVEHSPGKVSGAWVFRGTRVPVRALFENLEHGATVGDFVEWFPGVTRAQVDAVIEHAAASLTLKAFA